jgi:oxygen-independent coproporphyrinogen-3 oxidase
MNKGSITAEQLARISNALESTPTAAYTAPNDYPHAAPLFEQVPMLERERVTANAMRLYMHIPSVTTLALSAAAMQKRWASATNRSSAM